MFWTVLSQGEVTLRIVTSLCASGQPNAERPPAAGCVVVRVGEWWTRVGGRASAQVSEYMHEPART